MSVKPVVVLVGRPNVGKSTLFNRLTRSRSALVADFSGLTRDRHYGEGRVGETPFIVVDTGGFEPVAKTGILHQMARQTKQAIAEADVVIFMVDARAGLNAHDHDISRLLRKLGQRVILCVNKAEGMPHGSAVAEFHELGLGLPVAISAAHGDGIADLIEHALLMIGEWHSSLLADAAGRRYGQTPGNRAGTPHDTSLNCPVPPGWHTPACALRMTNEDRLRQEGPGAGHGDVRGGASGAP